jgi:hypothetical protein
MVVTLPAGVGVGGPSGRPADHGDESERTGGVTVATASRAEDLM